MKGRNPSRQEKEFWTLLAEVVGCIACRKDGRTNFHVSIHHIDGRTKEWAHKMVLPLCYPHHQGGQQDPPSVHPWKSRFEERYGTQEELLEECIEILTDESTLN